ncbi:hypothetical protein [Planococcus halotolerans]|uniref:Uncharacterized protein n=1 Tax=Planococcus halotolerans TaxID=2233542 RepID=A0A365L5L6_9BACL|nr:hypothetical protein [Planococcus halotolerans]RAZ80716.1 hypothetical protein DP120_00030 [Planococcus halotolerans]
MQKKVNNLYNYLKSWESNGSYKSMIVHRGNLKRVSNLHDTPWLQGPMIESLLEIYMGMKTEENLKDLIKAVEVQLGNLTEIGSYKNAGHEDDRFSSLIHNGLASIALAKVLINIDSEVTEEFQGSIKATINRNMEYLTEKLFSEEEKSFKFDLLDFYTHDNNHFVLNMNAIILEFIVLYELIFDKNMDYYAFSIIDFLDKHIVSEFIPYSNLRKDIQITIYSAIIGRGLVEYIIHKEGKIPESKKVIVINLLNKVNASIEDSLYKNMYFIHGKKVSNTEVYDEQFPVFISGSGIILDYLWRFQSYQPGKGLNIKELAENVLKHQNKNGGVKNYKGYYTKDNYRKINVKSVWEDNVPTPGWNGFLLLSLLKIFKNDLDFAEIKKESLKKTVILNYKFLCFEGEKIFILLSWFPLLSMAFYIFEKKKDKPIFCWDFRYVIKLFKKGYYIN